MRLIAIDPGSTESAFVALHDKRIMEKGKVPNPELLMLLRMMMPHGGILVIESVESFGMPVGRDVFQTVFWSGRFVEAFGGDFVELPRRQIKLHLCNSSRAKDPNVRQAVIDRFPATGGGKLKQVGTKALPGPLYGFSGDLWSALAVGITYLERAA